MTDIGLYMMTDIGIYTRVQSQWTVESSNISIDLQHLGHRFSSQWRR